MIQTGIDIIEVKRIKRIIQTNKKFLEKVYTSTEVSYCNSKKNKWQHFAVRFAAKEAVWKALGKKDIWHRDIMVKNAEDGKPEVILSKKYKKLQNKISLSLSHTDDYAVAVAVYNK
ncbi:MAG: holo-[acyl-carrier-protein] synthase [Elusimicrobia bacterium RIFOXYD2_FULL_34_15]|nr:MAG: holo-[acyl-carrier-protein] synthase [Elusimicrobia bacterium RIFOXYD2_FULL_34_15]